MLNEQRPLKVFLCHAHSDKTAVRDLYLRLTKDGVDAWLDKEKLLPGQDWEYEIRKAVHEADVVVVCLSKQFNQAGFRQKEVRLALDTAMEQPEGEIFIVPARLEECDTLESLRKWHWVDLFEDNGYEMLMRTLRARSEKIGVALQVEKGWLSTATQRSKEPVSEMVTVDKKWEAPEKRQPAQGLPLRRRGLNNKRIITVVAPLFLMAVVVLGLVLFLGKPSFPQPRLTEAAQVNSTPSLSSEITDANGVPMIFIPAGEFSMGSESDYDNEKPVHELFIDEFYVDKYEVTNALYKTCVDLGVCEPPMDLEHYSNSRYSNHPVVFVDWYMANAYCAWRGARLPTEAEWEKAARGADRRVYAWGNDFDAARANVFLSGLSNTNAVGMYENGKSPFGVYDLTGNVGEWTSSLYQSYPYHSRDGREDQVSTDDRVVRGGSFGCSDIDTRTTSRFPIKPSEFSRDNGFRCVKDAATVTPRVTLTSTQTLTPSITPTFTPMLTNTPAVPASGFILISIDKIAYIGGKAKAQIQAQPGAQCSLVFYLPSGKISTAPGVGNITADKDGYCAWSWSILGNVNPGYGTVVIIAGGQTTNYYIKIE